ncbi:MAG: LysR substrate-binding domain-containing protein [Marinibacterium sp.]
MKNLTLRQLRYFEALVRHRHFGRAADACAVSQPALSVQIRELEQELGLSLVERGARQVHMTGFGEEFARRSAAILRSVDDLGDFARASAESPLGRLRLGVIPTIGPYLLPAVLGRVLREYPGLDLHMRETLTSRLIAELLDGRLDAAIVALPVSESGITETPLFDEDLLLVRPQADAGKPVPGAEDLAKMRLLLLEEGHCFRDQALSVCGLRSAGSGHGLDGSSLSTLVQMVGAGLGVTFLPEMAVEMETRAAAVSLAQFQDPQPKRTVGMIWRTSSPLAGHLGALSEIVSEAGKDIRNKVLKA